MDLSKIATGVNPPYDLNAVIEIPPAGALTGLVKRALPGVQTLAVKTPDDLPAAWKLINEHGRPANLDNQPTGRLC